MLQFENWLPESRWLRIAAARKNARCLGRRRNGHASRGRRRSSTSGEEFVTHLPINAIGRDQDDDDDRDAIHHALDPRQDVAELGVQCFGERDEDCRADHRSPENADAAEQRDDQRLRRSERAEYGLRRHHQEDDRVDTPCKRRHRGRKHHGVHAPARRIDARRLRGRQVLLDREQRAPEARALDVHRHDHAGHHGDHRDHHVVALIGELHKGDRILALHRQRDFLITEPLEHVEHGERVGEHRQREVMPAQAECRDADQHARDHADHDAERNAEPRRDAELHERNRHRVGAEAEERGVAERDQAAVA